MVDLVHIFNLYQIPICKYCRLRLCTATALAVNPPSRNRKKP